MVNSDFNVFEDLNPSKILFIQLDFVFPQKALVR